MTTPYNLAANDFVQAFDAATQLVRDGAEGGGDNPQLDIQALVASGDCFITLATILDEASGQLGADAPIVRPQLERLTSTLMHLQRHYEIRRKPSDYRQ